jgi:hypothetical protein
MTYKKNFNYPTRKPGFLWSDTGFGYPSESDSGRISDTGYPNFRIRDGYRISDTRAFLTIRQPYP